MRVHSRRRFIQGSGGLLGCSLLAGCGLLRLPGGRAVRVRRIGFLESGPALVPPTLDAFREGLRELGYVEGNNLAIEYRDAGLNPERLSALAAELASVPVEVIVVS